MKLWMGRNSSLAWFFIIQDGGQDGRHLQHQCRSEHMSCCRHSRMMMFVYIHVCFDDLESNAVGTVLIRSHRRGIIPQ